MAFVIEPLVVMEFGGVDTIPISGIGSIGITREKVIGPPFMRHLLGNHLHQSPEQREFIGRVLGVSSENRVNDMSIDLHEVL